MAGGHRVLVDAPHWIGPARPVKESTVAAFALQPAETFSATVSLVMLHG